MAPPRGLSSSPSFTYPGRGDVIAGRYRVERKLGAGGMGVVVAALDQRTGARVAVKLLLPQGGAPAFSRPDDSGVIERSNRHQEMATRLLREASAAARLSSEHVTRVLDVGRLEQGDPFVVMELLEGVDLGRYSKERGPLPVTETVTYVLQACEAIAEAHGLGIVHRDLKPANLFLVRKPDGTTFVKVLDFGISKVLGSDDQQLTATSDMLGSPLYMAPEQIRNAREVDGRADVWSLGTILYRLLAGRAAFEAEGSAATLAAIIGDAPAPLRSVRPDVPQELEAIILRCLEKDRARRVQSVRELAIALTRFGVAQSGTYLPLISAPPAVGSAQGVTSVAPNSVTVGGGKRVPAARAVGIGLMVLALLGGGFAAWKLGGSPPATVSAGNETGPTGAELPSGKVALNDPRAAPEPGTTSAAPAASSAAPAASSAAPAASSAAPAASSAAPAASSTAPGAVRPPPRRTTPAEDPLGDRY